MHDLTMRCSKGNLRIARGTAKGNLRESQKVLEVCTAPWDGLVGLPKEQLAILAHDLQQHALIGHRLPMEQHRLKQQPLPAVAWAMVQPVKQRQRFREVESSASVRSKDAAAVVSRESPFQAHAHSAP